VPRSLVPTDVTEVDGVRFSWRLGCRGHPDLPPGVALLVRAARDRDGPLLDSSGWLGLPARAAVGADATVLTSSASAATLLRHDLAGGGVRPPARRTELQVRPGLPWDAEPGVYRTVVLAPPAERGHPRVLAELDAAARALREDGELLLLLDKDRGAKRYEREAALRFGAGGVVARAGTARLSRWREPRPAATAAPPWTTFDLDGEPLRSLAGCHASGKLDPGTGRLLDALARADAIAAGQTVLDLGCGWGAIARFAADRGARVDAVDDDLAAVRSCRENVPGARVRHLDGVTGLDPHERYDRVLVNPPFHVGRAVRTELGRALLRAAHAATAPDGELWWVANRDLRYERLPELAGAELVADEGGFRVSRWRPRSVR
jgi:16S rRNA (guanine1207-N2)-methyltransferase